MADLEQWVKRATASEVKYRQERIGSDKENRGRNSLRFNGNQLSGNSRELTRLAAQIPPL